MREPEEIAGFHRVRAYNEGLVVYLYDDSLLEQWKQGSAAPGKAGGGKRGRKSATSFPPGAMLSYELPQDNDLRVDLAVRSPLSEEEMGRLAVLDPLVGFLRLPTGRLCVECANDFRFDPDLDEAGEGGGTLIGIPPGNYRVRIYHLDRTALAADEQYEYQGPQQVVTLEPAGAGEAPSGTRPHLAYMRKPKPRRERKPDISWRGRYNVVEGVFTGEFVHNYDVSGPCINFDRQAGSVLELQIGNRLLVEFDNARIAALFLGDAEVLHPDADRFAAVPNHTRCGYVTDREGIEKLMLFQFPDRDMMHFDFRKTPLCGTPVRITRLD